MKRSTKFVLAAVASLGVAAVAVPVIAQQTQMQHDGMMGDRMGMMGGGMGAPVFIPTPMMYGYSAGKLVKSAYFESSFHLPTFEHNQERKISETDNVMDCIRAYEDKIGEANSLTLTYIFRRGNEFVFCYYLSDSDKYYFVPFPILKE